MYKIGINQNENVNYDKKSHDKQAKRQLWKVISLLFIIIIVISAMLGLIIGSNNGNNIINTNNSSNWNPNQNKTWKDYYRDNCPPNKKYNLMDYESNFKKITLKCTDKTLKFFYLNDLLKHIDNILQKNNINIPNNFFEYLPINPAIDIKINDEDALRKNFSMPLPPYNEKTRQFKIVVSVNQLGDSYNLVRCDLNFNFNIENDVIPEKFDISNLANKIIMPLQLIPMLDVTNGTKNEIQSQINEILQDKFLEKVNEEKLLPIKITTNDFTIDYSSIKDFDNYITQKKITIGINANKNNIFIKSQLNISCNVKGTWIKKSLTTIKSLLVNDESVINESVTVVDDTNVSKADIDNYITSLISKKINECGKKIWHQDFTEQDYIITNNAITGNYQVAKDVIITITGKNQLQDTIELQISIKCHNQCANEKIFKSSDFDVNNLNSIALYPNVLAKRIIYPITFKDDSDTLIPLLFKESINDMNDFSRIKNGSLEINVGIKLDGDNYQIHSQQEINFNVIKNINEVVLVSDSKKNVKYQHVTTIDILIKYDDNKEYKILEPINVNIENNNLTFINFSSLVKITSWR